MSKIENETNGHFTGNVTIQVNETWLPTPKLRWNRKLIRETYLNTLEQLWISNTGNEEWRDIPQVGIGI
jgi:hypothetical protein